MTSPFAVRLRRLLKDGPTLTDAHVPSPEWKRKKRKRVAAALLRKTGPWDGTWAEQSGLGEALAAAVHESWLQHNPNDKAHGVPYAELAEDAKTVDRDAVKVVLRGILSAGYHISPSS